MAFNKKIFLMLTVLAAFDCGFLAHVAGVRTAIYFALGWATGVLITYWAVINAKKS
jgi:hypothetical protein